MKNNQSSNHPTKDIIGSKGTQLSGKKICLCVTSSVAIMNSPHLARELMRYGAEVFPVMTNKATELMGTTLLHWSTGNQVITDITGEIEHVFMAGERENIKGFADLIIIYPATANTIGKISHGLADNAVSAISMVALGSKVPIFLVPAMHDSMFNNPIVKENLSQLKTRGIQILGPRLEENKAKIAEIEEVVERTIQLFQPKKDFAQKKILITYGSSREFIDDIRFISNSASGKTGKLIAENAINRGAEVTVLRGIHSEPSPLGSTSYKFTSTLDCATQIKMIMESQKFDIVISTAAFADFTPNQRVDEKISSNNDDLTLKLVSTPKILKLIRKIDEKAYITAFKAETTLENEKLISKAKDYLNNNRYDLIVANNIHPSKDSQGMGKDLNQVFIIDKLGNIFPTEVLQKSHIAEKILDIISTNV